MERKNNVFRIATSCLQRLPKKPHEILCKDFILSDNVRFLSPRKHVFSRVAGKLFGIHCAVAAIDPEVLVWSARTTFVVLRPAVFSDCLRSPTRYCAKTSFFQTTSDSFHHASVFFFARCRKVVRHSLRSGCDRSRGARVERKNNVFRIATSCLQRLPKKPHEILCKDFILSDNVRFLSPRKRVFSRVAGKLFDIHCAVAAIDPEVLV